MAYQLNSPKIWKIHDVFHVNLLKRYVFDLNHQLPELVETSNEGNIIAEPKNILSTKIQQL
jgi:hypothetical protein